MDCMDLNNEQQQEAVLASLEKGMRELCGMAYPSPTKDTKKSVMSYIGAVSSSRRLRGYSSLMCSFIDADFDAPMEKTSFGKLILAKANTKTAKKLVKYGSLAACLVITVLVGIKILPNMTGMTDTADEAYNESVLEAVSEFSLANGILKSPYTLYSASEDSVYDTEAETEESRTKNAVIELEQEAAKEVSGADLLYADEAIPDDDGDAALDSTTSMLMGTSDSLGTYSNGTSHGTSHRFYSAADDCEHSDVFRNSYHDIPKPLVKLVGDEGFAAWAAQVTKKSACDANIVSFFEYFNEIDPSFKEKFLALLEGDLVYYLDVPDAELFAAEDYDAICEYYFSGGDYEKAVGNYFEHEYKMNLIAYVGTSSYAKWLEVSGISGISEWSLSDLAGAFSLTAEELEMLYGETKAELAADYPDAVFHTYDFDKILSASSESQIGCGRAADKTFRK